MEGYLLCCNKIAAAKPEIDNKTTLRQMLVMRNNMQELASFLIKTEWAFSHLPGASSLVLANPRSTHSGVPPVELGGKEMYDWRTAAPLALPMLHMVARRVANCSYNHAALALVAAKSANALCAPRWFLEMKTDPKEKVV